MIFENRAQIWPKFLSNLIYHPKNNALKVILDYYNILSIKIFWNSSALPIK